MSAAGTVLRKARRAVDLTQTAVALALDVSPSFVCGVEAGRIDAGLVLRPRKRRDVLVHLLGEDVVVEATAALVCPTCGRGW